MIHLFFVAQEYTACGLGASDYCSRSVEDLTRYLNISDKGFLTPNSCTRFLLSGDNPLMNFIFMTISSKSLPIPIACNFIILMYSLTELSNCNGNAALSTFLFHIETSLY